LQTKIFFYQDCNLDIFEQIANTSEPTKEFVKRELLIFKSYELDVLNIKRIFEWWQKHEAMFLLVDIFRPLLDLKLKHKGFFLWLEYLLTSRDVICYLKD
jgi:hypothetical protein